MIGFLSSHVLIAEENEIATSVSVGGSLQVEAQFNQDYDAIDSSDFVVDEATLWIEAQVHKWVKAQLVFLYEEDATPLEIDEAFITWSNPDVSPVYLKAGQLYVPFGHFDTHMISDPLTLEVAETREKAVKLGFNTGRLYGSVYTFNGSTQDDSEDKIDHYGASIGFTQETGNLSYDLGVGYINDIGDTGGLTDALGGDNVASLVNYDYVEGLDAYFSLGFGSVKLMGEYVTALDTFHADHLTFNGKGAEPKAWHTEIAYTFNMVDKEMTLALGYQGSDEATALGLPEKRYLGVLSAGVYQNTKLSLEYAFDEDYAESDGGTGEDAHQIILQLAVEF
jgi:hypothetical protein